MGINRLMSNVWHGAGVPSEAYGIRYVPHRTLVSSAGDVVRNYDFDWDDLAGLG